MSVPAADLPAPIAVLVLAWGEASPAVRALVAATAASAPTIDSILVMVPQADAPDHLSAEEYLPLTLPSAENIPLAVEAASSPSAAEASPPLAETPPPTPAATALLRAEALEEDAEPASDELLLPGQPLASTAAPALAWAAVRVLRLGSQSLLQLARLAGRPLPAPAWLGPAAMPAAPYLGAEVPAAPEASRPAPMPEPTTAASFPKVPTTMAAAEPKTLKIASATAPGFAVNELPTAAPLATLAELPPQAAALEADFLPLPTDELEQFELASHNLAAHEDATIMPEQASWPEALASLRQPAREALAVTPAPEKPMALAQPEPADAAAIGAAHPALRPAAGHYPAPDLNYQIIQYARFAVPVALADAAFDAIYAPAWPTWLAAQELRQRTGKPLVLHLAALAAPEDESAETATGWIAELQRQALRRADFVLAETPALAQRLHHELGLAAGTVRVVAAADAEAIAQALHEARPRPVAGPA